MLMYLQGALVIGLQNRFKEFRRERKFVKKENQSDENAEAPSKTQLAKTTKKKLDSIKKPVSSLVQPPDIPPGEDEHSFSRFNGMLKAEARKTKPNRDVVNKLMERTYSQRRKHILTTPMPLSQLLQQYPFLKREDEVH